MEFQSSLVRRTVVCLLVMWVTIAAQAGAVVCSSDQAPAATLLIPYFEVDISNCAGAVGTNTLVNFANATSAPTLVHVTVWTDMAFPAIDFDMYLAGFDSQQLDLHSVICAGVLPPTGKAVSPHSPFSDPAVEFPGCNQTATPGLQPVYDNPVITGSLLNRLQNGCTGLPLPSNGECAGWPYGDQRARGYMTIDVVTKCSTNFPSDAAYYTNGVIGFDNRLLGWFSLREGAGGTPHTYSAVHIEAAPTNLQDGDTTFYGRYVPVATPSVDRREPLPTTWAALYAGASGGKAPILAWRETSSAAASFTCGTPPPAPPPTPPAWYPLPMSMIVGGGPFISFDETGAATAVASSLALASQRVEVGAGLASDGWLYLNLQHPQSPTSPGQGWVAVDRALATGAPPATALDSSCSRANMTVTRPGTTTSNPPNFVVPVELMSLIVQ